MNAWRQNATTLRSSTSKCKDTKALNPKDVASGVRSKSNVLQASQACTAWTGRQYLDDLKVPPGNGLEALKDDRKGQHSIRI